MSEQKSALITGCSDGGIGAALARVLKDRGFRVFATARKLEKMKLLQELECDCLILDVEDETTIRAASEEVRKLTGGKLDLLINNAGINYFMTFADSDVNVVRRIFEVNTISVYSVSQAFLPLLVASGGTIANIGSINAQLAPAFQSGYSASKAALESITDAMRLELEPLGVKVVIVHTGAVGSNIFNNMIFPKLPTGSFYEPIRKDFESADFFKVSDATPAHQYAKRVINDLLKKSPRASIWHGKFTTMARWIWRLLICLDSPGLMNGAIRKLAGLNKLPLPSSTKEKSV